MNYIGSKLSLLEFLKESINTTLKLHNEAKLSKDMVFADLFAGTGIVGTTFKKEGYSVIANDLQHYSFALNKHFIENTAYLTFDGLSKIYGETPLEERAAFICEFLQNIDGEEGFIYNNYCPGGTQDNDYQRMYYTDDNGKKCDAIRRKIQKWFDNGLVTDEEYYFLLACLIEAIDKVANTASVYGAFLKKIKKSAQKNIKLVPLEIVLSDRDNRVYNSDINELITEIDGDILYLDPPYNNRQYAPNYHMLETISKYDNPDIKGKTGLRNYTDQKSDYCSKRTASKAFEDLISKANFKYIFLSYNCEGIIPIDEIEKIMKKYGEYSCFEQDYKRFKADKTENRNHKKDSTTEYLHCLVK